MPTYDVAVVGLGAMGSSTLHALARRGVRAIGVERFEPGHSRSSSYGESRIIRLAYFEHPSYVPLLKRAYEAWRRLEAATGERVLTVTGILEAGYPGAELVEGSLASSIEHGLPHEVLTAREVRARFPAFDLPDHWTCIFQPDAGVLLPEKAIALYVAAAQELDAAVRLNTRVLHVRPVGDRVVLELENGETIEAGSAVIAAGPWIGDLVQALGDHLRLTRQPLMWFKPRDAELVRPGRMPLFFLQSEEDLVYGFPDINGSGVKAASHLAGGELKSGDQARAEATAEEAAHLRDILDRYVPAAAGDLQRTHVCAYSRSPDEHFIVGLHPQSPQIVLASPCSGHGFKFASIIGEMLADLAMDRSTDWPIDLFRPDRVLAPDRAPESENPPSR
jgi:sarcosine oxidase